MSCDLLRGAKEKVLKWESEEARFSPKVSVEREYRSFKLLSHLPFFQKSCRL